MKHDHDRSRPRTEPQTLLGLRVSEVMRLEGKDRDAFLAALINPPAPSPRLIAALRRHRELFG